MKLSKYFGVLKKSLFQLANNTKYKIKINPRKQNPHFS